MSPLRRIEGRGMPQAGEHVRIYQLNRLIAQGQVICVDSQVISIAGDTLINLDTDEVRRGLHDGSIRIERPLRR